MAELIIVFAGAASLRLCHSQSSRFKPDYRPKIRAGKGL